MEYERIDKVQSGISPSKLRMKLMGPHYYQRKKDGSNCNSSRTSPSRIDDDDAEFVNSLLASNNGDIDEEVPRLDVAGVNGVALDSSLNDQLFCQSNELLPRESIEVCHAKLKQYWKSDNGNSGAIHLMTAVEDENLDYDSNASSSSFEFHKGEGAVHSSLTRLYSRPMSSKWNDAEKWIMNGQNALATYSKKNEFHGQANRFPMTNMGRVAPASSNYDHRSAVNRVTESKGVCFEKFSFIPSDVHPISAQPCGRTLLSDQCPLSKNLREVARMDLSCTQSLVEDTTVLPAIRSVSMRDMGTEMTTGTSQEPSRTATPVGAATPFRSPTSSIPSTPHRGALTSKPTDDEPQNPAVDGKKELSEQERKLKTRRDIVALSVQLGKTNIAAWASKDEEENVTSSGETSNIEELEQIEYRKRAAVWEEAEKSKHTSRYKCEEIKIRAWESQQRAKLEAEMRRIEAKEEQMRAQAQAKMVKKIAMARQRSEEKRTAAEARKNRAAERTAARAEYIRRTGRMPSSQYICCGWFHNTYTVNNE